MGNSTWEVNFNNLPRIYKIGRNTDKADIPILEGTISRIHAELEYTKDGNLFVKDLKSGIINYFRN